MMESEDESLESEKLLEQARRFTDSWLTNVQHLKRTRPSAGEAKPFLGGPCQVRLLEMQQSDPLRIFGSANPAFNKLAALLCYIIEVLETLFKQLETEVAPKLSIFGEEPQNFHRGRSDGDIQIWLARSLPFFRKLEDTATLLKAFLKNLLVQLGSLCAEHTRKSTIIQGEFARKEFLTVAEGFAWLLRLEILLIKNTNIKAQLGQFVRMLQTVQRTPGGFSTSEQVQAQQLEQEVQGLLDRLVDDRGGLFRTFLDIELHNESTTTRACSSNAFVTAASDILRTELTAVVDRVSVAADEIHDRPSVLGLLAFSVFVFKVAGAQLAWDKKLLRKLLDLHQQIPLAPVWGEHMMQPASFLSQYLPSSLDGYIPTAYARQAGIYRAQQLSSLMDDFVSRAEHSALQVASTVSNLSQLLKDPVVTESLLTQTANTIVSALQLSSKIRQSFLLMLGCLKVGGLAIKRTAMRKFVHVACQIKGIEHAFKSQQTPLADALPHVMTHVMSDISGLLEAMSASIRASMRSAAGNQGMLTLRAKRERAISALQDAAVAVDGASAIARGAVSNAQLNALVICMEAVQTTMSVPEQETGRILRRISTLSVLRTLHLHVTQVTDCSFLYYNRHLLDAGLKDVLDRPYEAGKLYNFLSAFLDGHMLLQGTNLDISATHKAYDDELESSVMKHLVEPVCDTIETQLRLLHHHSQEEQGEPDTPIKDFRPLLQCSPLHLQTRAIHIKSIVEQELTMRLYNHTAVALHDGHANSQMVALAKHRMNLSLQHPQLPGSDIDPGLDLVEVREQLASFAAGYAYSLVSQNFIQRADSEIVQTEVDAANHHVNVVREELEEQNTKLRTELDNVKLEADTAKAQSEMLLEEAQSTKATELEQLKRKHENETEDMQARYERQVSNATEDAQRTEQQLLERLSLSSSKIEHLQDRVVHLEDKLEIAKEAAAAAAQAAKSAGVEPGPAAAVIASQPKAVDRKLEPPEKISPQALRESIMVLQEQLQAREQRIEELEQIVAKSDPDAAVKISKRDDEIIWLRELLSVRHGDLQDIITALSGDAYNREAVKDAAIRLKANLQMEEQERERAMNGGSAITLPNIAQTIQAATPRVAQAVGPIAAAWGSWRKSSQPSFRSISAALNSPAGSNATPSKSRGVTSPQNSLLGGLLTPPASGLRQTPPVDNRPQPTAFASTGRRYTSQSSAPLRPRGESTASRRSDVMPSVQSTPPRQHERRDHPQTPPMMRESGYDSDAQPGDFDDHDFFEED